MRQMTDFVARAVIALATLVALGAHDRSSAANATTAQAVPLRSCAPDSGRPAGSLCGTVAVPENRTLKGSRQIALNVVVLPARSGNGHGNPIFGLAGGPGIGSTRLAIRYPRLYDTLQAEHDIVLVDQRGIGASQPLVCAATDYTKQLGKVFDQLPDSRTLAACRDRLAKQADLMQYTTTAAVEDLDAVRQALGYSRINLFGVSYGTRVALKYLRRHEPNVRAIAVSGVFSAAYRIGVHGPAESQHALQQLFAMCAADTFRSDVDSPRSWPHV